ncbi:MAG: alanine racemase [Candidatus Hodarchaeales archaeon]|jgi:D-serine deaminase-like pyridoxal phosphate-dependent protein
MLKIKKPTAIVDEGRVRNNIMKMISKVEKSQIKFRPHFKTHQSKEIGEWFKEYGISAITVSSVDMAYYFAKEGWDDITIAIPYNLNQIDEINSLAQEISLHILVDTKEASHHLAENLTSKLSVWIEINNDYNRSGVHYQNTSEILNIARILNETDLLNLEGILTHAGNSYTAKSFSELNQIHTDAIKIMNDIKDEINNFLPIDVKISVGDTPTCSIVKDFKGVDEIRPGNFVFYDLTQLKLGVCEENDIALVVACPVISKNEIRNEVVIYGGAIHLSKDSLIWNGTRSYGKVTFLKEDGWSKFLDDTNVTSLSQEHGVIKMNNNVFNQISIGDILVIIPIHSCLTANLYTDMYSLNGNKLPSFKYTH